MYKFCKSIAIASTLLLSSAGSIAAQQVHRVDVAITYIADRSLKAGTDRDFWMQGGSLELGVNAWKGLGFAADITGMHAGSIANSNVPISLVTITFGPRYRWHAEKKISVYGQALVGEANGFRSIFPVGTAGLSSSNSLALQLNGGVDYRLKQHYSVRLIDAGWGRTQLPNGTNNVQNHLRLGAGFVARF